ncbi:MAG TPA: tRNA (adenosine(37)-N6)-dimethylallyltransferase MiaA [Gaiellales bacterium]|nr:tRNA (adenosine(37)-N6)-dimethylallyltransferase MiaA [Gaiellales bacterium]
MTRVIAVFGPTASGKSAAALELAQSLDAEIVSCDAMQLYAGLPVLTNQPSPEELAAVPHHLVGIWPLDHEGSVAEYGGLARAAIAEIRARGRDAVLVGGSGLYLRSALAPLDLPPRPRPGDRERFAELYDTEGAGAAHALLTSRDPAAAIAVHPNDRRRVVRALELAEIGASLAPDEASLWSEPPPGTVILGLEVPPDEVRSRIAQRTRAMFQRGVEDEVRRALGGELSSTAARIHGLQDVRALLAGDIDREEAIRRLDVRTRQYAKRQRVWMRRLPGLRPVAPEDVVDAVTR